MEFEIGIGKTARRAYGFDEVAIVPSRRTRDPEDVNIQWEIDAYTFELPMMASAMDAAVSPATAKCTYRRSRSADGWASTSSARSRRSAR